MLFFSDFDGTLFIDGKINPYDLAAISDFRNAGNHFAICTGRSVQEIQIYETLDSFIDFYIVSNGSAVFDQNKGMLVPFTYLGPGIVTALWEQVKAFNAKNKKSAGDQLYCTIEDHGFYCIERDEGFACYEAQLNQKYEQISGDDPLLQSDIKKVVMYAPAASLHAFRNSIRSIPRINGFCSLDTCYEIVPEGVDKAHAIMQLLDILKIPQNDCAVIGDSENDLLMIRSFEKSFAMIGGHTQAVQSATYQVASVRDAIKILLDDCNA